MLSASWMTISFKLNTFVFETFVLRLAHFTSIFDSMFSNLFNIVSHLLPGILRLYRWTSQNSSQY